MMGQLLLGLWSISLVDPVRGFNPLAVVPVHRAPRVQPQTAPKGVVRPQTMPGSRHSFFPSTPADPSGSSFLPPTPSFDPALLATLQTQRTVPTETAWEEKQVDLDAEEAAWEEPQMHLDAEGAAWEEPQMPEPDVEVTEQVTELQARGSSWYDGFAAGSFAAGIFAGFSAVVLALRSRIWRQSSTAPQQGAVELRQNLFSMSLPDPLLSVPGSENTEPVYTASPELRGTLQGSLVANFSPPVTVDDGQVLNGDLRNRLQEHFKPLGIVAWSGCCRLGCSGSYDEEDAEFVLRDRGVCYMRLHLDGMNYEENPEGISVMYGDHEYLMENWEQEKGLLQKWCEIVGLSPEQYNITVPENESHAIMISFNSPLELALMPEESDMGEFRRQVGLSQLPVLF